MEQIVRSIGGPLPQAGRFEIAQMIGGSARHHPWRCGGWLPAHRNGFHAMNQLKLGSPLPVEILQLIAHVTRQLGEAAVVLQRQAEVAIVVSCSATMLDVTVPSDLPAVDIPDGPTPGSARLYEREQLVGELLVWIRDGRLIGLEQAWYTDEPPHSWPDPRAVRVA